MPFFIGRHLNGGTRGPCLAPFYSDLPPENQWDCSTPAWLQQPLWKIRRTRRHVDVSLYRLHTWSLGSLVPWFRSLEVFQRVQGPAVDADLKMQVRTRRDARGADQGNRLPGPDHVTDAHQQFGRMPIDCADSVTVIDDHSPSIPVVPPREGHTSRLGGIDLRPIGRGDIDPVVVVLPSPAEPGRKRAARRPDETLGDTDDGSPTHGGDPPRNIDRAAGAGQPLSRLDQVSAAKFVGFDNGVHGETVHLSDFPQRFAFTDDNREWPRHPPQWWGRCCRFRHRRPRGELTRDHKALAHLDHIVVADLICRHQRLDRHTVCLSELPQGLSFLHDERRFA